MKLNEMFERLENHNIYTDYLVNIKYKYDWEEEYEVHNEILEAYNGDFVWLNDWDEGQTDVEVLGFVAIEDIPISKVVQWVAEEGSDLLFCSEEVNDPSGKEGRPKGEWNWHGDEDICNCPYCDFEIDAEGCIDPVEYVKIYNYCPHCGADMRGEE